MQKQQQVNNLKDVPVDRHPMKAAITEAFFKLTKEVKLSLKPSKSKALVDFISCQPHVSKNAVKGENIKHCFHEVGYIYTKK